MKLYISTGNSRMEKRWNNVEMELDEFMNCRSFSLSSSFAKRRIRGNTFFATANLHGKNSWI